MAEPILFLDFSGLEYMNSKSIGYLTDWFTKASEKNGTIAIIAPQANILDILKVVGITQIIKVYSSLEEAKASISTDNYNANNIKQTVIQNSPQTNQIEESVDANHLENEMATMNHSAGLSPSGMNLSETNNQNFSS